MLTEFANKNTQINEISEVYYLRHDNFPSNEALCFAILQLRKTYLSKKPLKKVFGQNDDEMTNKYLQISQSCPLNISFLPLPRR